MWRIARPKGQHGYHFPHVENMNRYEAACELIRTGDIIRTLARAGLALNPWHVSRLQALGERVDALAPKPRTSSTVTFPEWVR